MNWRLEYPWVIWSLRENFDRWSRFHLFGTYTLTDLSDRWWVGFIGALVWEGMDVAWYWETHNSSRATRYWILTNLTPKDPQPKNGLIDEVFDRRGFSWLDLALGWVAVLIWSFANGKI
jgi:hypothetical protein